MSINNRLKKYVEGDWPIVISALDICCGILIFFMMFSTVADTLFRYITGRGFIAVSEFNGIMLVILVFLAMLGTQKSRRHVRAELVQQRLGLKSRSVLDAISWAIALVFCAIMGVQTWKSFLDAYAIRQVAWGTDFSIWWAKIFIPLGCWLMCLQFLLDMIESISMALGFSDEKEKIREVDGVRLD